MSLPPSIPLLTVLVVVLFSVSPARAAALGLTSSDIGDVADFGGRVVNVYNIIETESCYNVRELCWLSLSTTIKHLFKKPPLTIAHYMNAMNSSLSSQETQ